MEENAAASEQTPGASSNAPASGLERNGVSKDARTWGMACHLLALSGLVVTGVGFVLGPLVAWLIKRDDDPFIDDQGKEAVNFQITMFLAFIVCFLLMFVVIGAFLMPIVAIGDIIFTIVAAVKANDGVRYRYPFSIKFLK
ncbi:DUF4870 domain-containing protein [bacterium]|nr:DUF4870 domain-containing protein [bacterium]